MPNARGARRGTFRIGRVWVLGIGVWTLGISIGACQREARPFVSELPVANARTLRPVLSQNFAGPPPAAPDYSPFQKNAYGTAEGKRLFDFYNCSGCHSHGGGGMGPALMDDKWIYGSRPANIFETIVEGRPNGMPSFGNKIPDAQVWELVAYIQSMSGLETIDVLPGRSDHMRYSTPENARRAETPVQTGTP
jgi:cytochrome c oxidase cbb3-type subunit 3